MIRETNIPGIVLPVYDRCSCSSHQKRIVTWASTDAINKRLWQDYQDGKQFSQEYFVWLADQYIDALDTDLLGRVQSVDFNQPDHILRAMMHANVYHFSAAKSTAMMTLLNDTVKSATDFPSFLNEVAPVLQEFNRNWLETEFISAKQIGINAARWLEQQSVKDVLPYLQYRTQRDGRVRATHSSLDGLTLPIDHPTWDSLYPPNGWRCRCFVVQLAKAPKTQNNTDPMERLDPDELERMKKSGFARNRAKDAIVYDPKSFYTTRKELNKNWNRTFGIKNTGLLSFSELLPNLTSIEIPNRSKEYAEAWFKSKMGDHDLNDSLRIRLLDTESRPVDVSWTQFQKKVHSKPAEERWRLIDFIEECLSSPDELIMLEDGRAGRYMLKYIKMYNPSPVVVVAELRNGKIELKSWYLMDKPGKIDQERQGIVLKKRIY